MGWLLLAGAAGVPLSLLWDFGWESTVGIDRVWAPPHVATWAAVALAASAAAGELRAATRRGVGGVSLLGLRAPLGAWVVLWGAVAFATASLFDRWWQTSYGLSAGIWHPPQILKAVAFFALVGGAWLGLAARQASLAGALAFACAGGAVLALITVVTLPQHLANRQHAASFFQLGCAAYPLVLVALQRAGRLRFAATLGAGAHLALFLAALWILPLVPGSPEVGPIYNPRDRLMPPPFPPLLVVPALALDLWLGGVSAARGRGRDAARALEAGLLFSALYVAVQWPLASFLLSPAADNAFFAGGGRHWPFFLRIDPTARTAFWPAPGDELDALRAASAALLAALSAGAGLRLGAALGRGAP
jgi:hypothetical protein